MSENDSRPPHLGNDSFSSLSEDDEPVPAADDGNDSPRESDGNLSSSPEDGREVIIDRAEIERIYREELARLWFPARRPRRNNGELRHQDAYDELDYNDGLRMHIIDGRAVYEDAAGMYSFGDGSGQFQEVPFDQELSEDNFSGYDNSDGMEDEESVMDNLETSFAALSQESDNESSPECIETDDGSN
ncbi:hypothetical protein GCK32_002337 [Trichostrongylus colubriformis]|uniref:Uncharacterized protein n=1 Tax=Trichostrongylus colubriformis TaxID=6319 RepID=A0AAN8ESC7_TRICO